MSGGQKLPSMKFLKDEKENLVVFQNVEHEEYQNTRYGQRDLQTVYINIRKMLGIGMETSGPPNKSKNKNLK